MHQSRPHHATVQATTNNIQQRQTSDDAKQWRNKRDKQADRNSSFLAAIAASLCLGTFAGNTSCPAGTIILNATGSDLSTSTAGVYISNIAGISGTTLNPSSSTSTGVVAGFGMLLYNPTTKELAYAYS